MGLGTFRADLDRQRDLFADRARHHNRGDDASLDVSYRASVDVFHDGEPIEVGHQQVERDEVGEKLSRSPNTRRGSIAKRQERGHRQDARSPPRINNAAMDSSSAT
jgi:hypothetical protein